MSLFHRMHFQKSSPASDLAIEPIKCEITGKEAREGVDMEEARDVTSDEEEDARGDDDDDGGGAATSQEAVAAPVTLRSRICENARPIH
jgi:hypothetical protein